MNYHCVVWGGGDGMEWNLGAWTLGGVRLLACHPFQPKLTNVVHVHLAQISSFGLVQVIGQERWSIPKGLLQL